MLNKSSSFILFCLCFSVLAAVLVAAPPPSLGNHQFYGDVIWNGTTVKQQVKAVVGSQEYTSRVENPSCSAGTCRGRYGYAEDNILRVQGNNGDTVTFYVDNEQVATSVYATDSWTKLDLDMTRPSSAGGNAQNASANASFNQSMNQTTGCDPNWNCSLGECVNGFKARTCRDLNSCNASYLSYTDNVTCTVTPPPAAPPTPVTCEYVWECTSWGPCASGVKTRTCSRTDTCDVRYAAKEVTSIITKPKPVESSSCTDDTQKPETEKPLPLPSCTDKIKNQNEEGVDCGGVCPVCSSLPWFYWAIPLGVVVLIALGVGGYFLFSGGKSALTPQQQQQLSNYFRAGMQRGMSKDQIKGNLVSGGWKEGAVKKFMKSLK